MAWTLLNALQIGLILVWTVVWITIALAARLITGSSRAPLALARTVWAPVVLGACGARLHVDGALQGGGKTPAVLVANHGSLLDIPALFAALRVPLHFVAKAELRRVPFLGWYIAAVGMVFVRRGEGGQTDRVVSQVRARLADGGSVIFFPEGTRSAEGAVGPFRSGAFVTAIRAAAPVVPLAIAGARRLMPPRGLRLRPGRIRVRIGRPLLTRGLDEAAGPELAGRARHAVVSLLKEAQSSPGGGS